MRNRWIIIHSPATAVTTMAKNTVNRVRSSSLPSVSDDCWCRVRSDHQLTDWLTMGRLTAPTSPTTAARVEVDSSPPSERTDR